MHGRVIWYDKVTGTVLAITGEYQGEARPPTFEEGFGMYQSLSGRTQESVGYISLEPGEYAADFAEMTALSIDPATENLLFTYSDPGYPDPAPAPSMSQRLTELERQNAQMLLALVANDLL